MDNNLKSLFNDSEKYKEYKNGDTVAIFSEEKYSDGEKSNFTESQWNKLLVKNESLASAHPKHRVYYRHDFNKKNKNTLIIIMFNPSTATHLSNDPTINNCKKIAEKNNYGSFEVFNLLTIRDPNIKRAIKNANSKMMLDDENFKKYLSKKNILLAWGGLSGLNKEEKEKKKKLHT